MRGRDWIGWDGMGCGGGVGWGRMGWIGEEVCINTGGWYRAECFSAQVERRDRTKQSHTHSHFGRFDGPVAALAPGRRAIVPRATLAAQDPVVAIGTTVVKVVGIGRGCYKFGAGYRLLGNW